MIATSAPSALAAVQSRRLFRGYTRDKCPFPLKLVMEELLLTYSREVFELAVLEVTAFG